MRKTAHIGLISVSLLLVLGLWAQQKDSPKIPATFSLSCLGGDCPLLKGAPQTRGRRGGSVKLNPGESVGWHSTSQNEEALVILHGRGAASIEGQADVLLEEKMLAYIPSGTRHNVRNTGTDPLEYVWVVAPVASR